MPLPDAVSFEAALALMVQGLTALYLTNQISPKDKTVLVNAAAGGSDRSSSSLPNAPEPKP